MKNAEIYGGGGPNIGNILRAGLLLVLSLLNQGKVVWQTNVKNAEKII